ncbi:LacI family transcriptional regulator [Jatrophihabitans telluris]|uniref:LacI family transcriptional regulator n=1 Tax=Jatrophihabitans telluris TaxID=2038343 RepID=A0ABY4R144_9ACTN|nr:LacI family DNA-binding transcriptional regulator [Jatrophihabitans telluris]UQX89495.1 LacI family transcriptional regulator [Jatrophihabitans telluris]
MPKPPTIRDVAAEAGVSRSTVSRVLNGAVLVKPEVAEAVRAAMERIRYVPSHSARSLNTRRSGAIALVVAEAQERLFEDPTTSTLVRELNAVLPEHEQTLYLTLADDDRSRRSVVGQLRSGLLDGIILTSTHGNDPIYRMLLDAQPTAPVVVFGAPFGDGRKLPYVTVRDQSAARQLTRHLISTGRRHIGIIAGPQDTGGGRKRLLGFRAAFDEQTAAAGITAHEALTDNYSWVEGERAMRQLLDQTPELDAVFAASDLLASGALAVLDRAGRRVPQDIALAGFDDSVLARQARPQLTTARIPFDRLAAALIEVLLARIEGRDVEPVTVDCTLVLRESTAVGDVTAADSKASG